MSQFKWNPKKRRAAFSLAQGATQQNTGDMVGVTRKTIHRWLQDPVFSEEVDSLTLKTGIAVKAERLRIIKRIVNARIDKAVGSTVAQLSKADTLEMLKYAQNEIEKQEVVIVGDQERPITYQIVYSDDETDIPTDAAYVSENGNKRSEPV